MNIPLTAADRMLVLLAHYEPLQDAYFYPPEMTQEGISEQLDVSRSHVARELKKLLERGHVKWSTERVAEAKKKVKVYRLTATGLAEAARLDDEMSEAARCAPRPPDADDLTRFGGEMPGPRFGGD